VKSGVSSSLANTGQALKLKALPVSNALSFTCGAAALALPFLPDVPAPGAAVFSLAALGLSVSFSALGIALGWRFNARLPRVVKSIEARAFDRAMRDALTGLYNRSGFKMKLEEALEARDGDALVGVIYVDLDRFKAVNDGFGHEMGDKLLMAVTERMQGICSTVATIARLGGDEFAMIVHGCSTTEEIEELGRTISAQLGQHFFIDSTEISIGGSVGMVVAPEDGTDQAILVRRADIAMYRVKAAGRGQAIRFLASMEDEIRRRRFLEEELRHAIARDQLQVLYQPCMASDGETLVGVEALLRWHHPAEGTISPAEFIPLAEQTGLIVDIGEWVMRRALKDALDWPEIHVAVNVSPVQFRRPELLENTLSIVHETGIEARRVEIEITEGVLMEDAEAAIGMIKGFRDAGFSVALDDFGTGYASLSYLRRFPFSKLKVDQAFVRNLGVITGSAAIIHSVVSLGRSLGMLVHAEGVETLEHHIFLRAAGCHHFQGYYFGKPMPKSEIDKRVAKNFGGAVSLSRLG
jgi:diguanylate cyclase (GGDEF)-like protein